MELKMRLNKILTGVLIGSIITTNLFARNQISLNINDLEIMDFVKLTSKIIGKNILIDQEIRGKVKFEQNRPLYEDEVINILMYVLENKGFTIVDNKGILRLVQLGDIAKHNTPVYHNVKNLKQYQMVTEVFTVEYANVDYVTAKIKHLISKSAKIVTDKNSNSIVLTDFVSNIKTVKSVINMIVKDSKKEIQIVELENLQGTSVLADLKNVAKTVFNEKVEKERVSILLNKDTNSIMFVGKKENVDFLVDYLNKIEKKGSLIEKVVEVIYLKNAESKNILKILTGIIAKKIYKDKEEQPFASTDEESNAIILMGPKEEVLYFTKLVNKLDIDRQQVYVEARIIEISEARTKDVGVKYGLLGGKSSTNSGLMTFAANMGSNAVAIDTSVLGLSIPSLTKGLALGASINLLNQNGAADIVSEPSLLCINNKESSIYVGETRSIKTGTTTTTGGNINDTYKREDIGLTLKVKPRISNGNKVSLQISTKLEDVGQTTTNDQPNTYKKDLTTTAIVNNGESIILGGYIKAKSEYTTDKVPVLGDIPLFGTLFKNNRKINDKINLVIIITPYIVPKTKDLTYVRNQLAQLKLLENKYTKDSILRLEKEKLQEKTNDLKREIEKIDIDKQKEELKNNMIEFSKEKEEYDNIKKNKQLKELNADEKVHEKRIKDMFGI
jgi:general secretion pathway protein D